MAEKVSKRYLKIVGQHPTRRNQEEAQEQPEQPEEAVATWPPKSVKH